MPFCDEERGLDDDGSVDALCKASRASIKSCWFCCREVTLSAIQIVAPLWPVDRIVPPESRWGYVPRSLPESPYRHVGMSLRRFQCSFWVTCEVTLSQWSIMWTPRVLEPKQPQDRWQVLLDLRVISALLAMSYDSGPWEGCIIRAAGVGPAPNLGSQGGECMGEPRAHHEQLEPCRALGEVALSRGLPHDACRAVGLATCQAQYRYPQLGNLNTLVNVTFDSSLKVSILKQELEKTKAALDISNGKLKLKEELAAAAMAAQAAAERSLKLADSRAAGHHGRIEELTRQLEEAESRERNRHKVRHICWPWRFLKANRANNTNPRFRNSSRMLPEMQALLL
ncbi:hypothetical protein TEA_029073 [Camellia sinensis var. sinensis]|uniref:Uncharacterized protein n=1 Tax=Camellia sinensis var. sinensis TaxID=542762 RepID=A0A4V3WM99_CAMSN|nr:hypothetical protein TEA_029073 [Camellia sinensis var. sinensis]